MRKLVFGLVIAILAVIALIVSSLGSASDAYACNPKKKPCGYNQDPGVTYQGNQHPKNMVKVTLCFGEWSLLKSGSGGRWWGPTVRRGSWKADLPAVHSECTTRWLVKGTTAESESACTPGKILRSEKISAPGTYVLN